jgi:hypothetical protein
MVLSMGWMEVVGTFWLRELTNTAMDINVPKEAWNLFTS